MGPPAFRSRVRSAGSDGGKVARTAGNSRPGRGLRRSLSLIRLIRESERYGSKLALYWTGRLVQFLPLEQTTFVPMTTTSQGWADLYAWQLERASGTPLSRQIYMQVRAAVLSGALRAGTRVPSSRMMAARLGVARASVVAASEQL